MMQLAWPWVLLALPLPWLTRLFLPPTQAARGGGLRVPFYGALAADSESIASSANGRSWRWWLAWAAYLLLVVAAARPQWVGEPVALPVSGRDLLLAVDLSGSMDTQDMRIQKQAVNRLDAVKVVMGEFIERRQGDRLGLILFGDQPYLQAPLTFDRQTVRAFLEESVIGLAGKSTAIGDAIGLATKRLRERPQENRVLILLTDGANTAGELEPRKAAEIAAAEGIRIYTIGVGADEMIVRDFFGARRVNPSRDLDEKTLRAIAEETGGKYFRARDTRELAGIYRMLDELEPVEVETETFRPLRALYAWPLGLAWGLGLLILLGNPSPWRRHP